MSHAYLQDESRTHILAHQMPQMFDEQTLVTDVALAKKCIEALGDRVIVVPARRLQVNAKFAGKNLEQLGVEDLSRSGESET